MDAATLAEHLRAEGLRLAEVARGGSGEEPVDDCPGWTLDDLLRHLGAVHVWSSRALLAGGDRPGRTTKADAEQAAPTEHAHLVEWYAETHDRLLVDLGRSLEEGSPCWTFLPEPQGAAFWARRAAHETAVHRVDVERAVKVISGLDTALAHDGVDELLAMAVGNPGLVTEPALSLVVHSVDTGGRWLLTIGPEARELRLLGPDEPTPTAESTGTRFTLMSGAATGLYLALWNRLDPLTSDRCVSVSGETSLVALWRERVTIG